MPRPRPHAGELDHLTLQRVLTRSCEFQFPGAVVDDEVHCVIGQATDRRVAAVALVIRDCIAGHQRRGRGQLDLEAHVRRIEGDVAVSAGGGINLVSGAGTEALEVYRDARIGVANRVGELDPATAHRYLTEINQEVVHMAGLVDDLILLSRLDAHRLAVGEEQVDAVRLVRRLQQELAPIADTKGITLQLETPTTPLPPIQTNLNHAHVVVRNLLDNALKYTPTGGKVLITLVQQQAMVQLQELYW